MSNKILLLTPLGSRLKGYFGFHHHKAENATRKVRTFQKEKEHMTIQLSDDQHKKRLLAFRAFLGKIKEDHPNELRELKSTELALFEIQNNTPTLRIHAKINAALRRIIHAKWIELFPVA